MHPLHQLLLFAAQQVPHYRSQAWAAKARAGQPFALADVPISARMRVRLEKVTEMPLSAGGKFLMHESRIGHA